jgi:hypothetical protein
MTNIEKAQQWIIENVQATGLYKNGEYRIVDGGESALSITTKTNKISSNPSYLGLANLLAEYAEYVLENAMVWEKISDSQLHEDSICLVRKEHEGHENPSYDVGSVYGIRRFGHSATHIAEIREPK